MDESPADISPTHLLFALIGLALLGMVGIFVFASTLIAPVWAVVMMGAIWLAAAVWAWLRWRRSMFAPLLAAVVVGAVWIAAVNLGDVLLGWNA
ncbi:MAG: hypothetical protein QNJ88_09880 [Acidimicrobiia bacterium]|nr:hypothetical protein [Acidimicrobiia bacterium]